MTDVLEKGVSLALPPEVRARMGHVTVDHSGRLADLHRITELSRELGYFFSFDLSDALRSNLPSRDGGVRHEICLPKCTLEVAGKTVLLSSASANAHSFFFAEGSVKTTIAYTLGFVASIYTGVATYPSFEEGIRVIYSRLEPVISESFEHKYKRVLSLEVQHDDVHFSKTPEAPFSIGSDRPKLTKSDREFVMKNQQISVEACNRNLFEIESDLQRDAQSLLSTLPVLSD